MKTRNRLLASLLTIMLTVGMVPSSAFAENEPAATGTDVAVENAAGDEGSSTKKNPSPSDSGELPELGETKEQGDSDGKEKASASNPAPSPSSNEQGTPPAVLQENANTPGQATQTPLLQETFGGTENAENPSSNNDGTLSTCNASGKVGATR